MTYSGTPFIINDIHKNCNGNLCYTFKTSYRIPIINLIFESGHLDSASQASLVLLHLDIIYFQKPVTSNASHFRCHLQANVPLKPSMTLQASLLRHLWLSQTAFFLTWSSPRSISNSQLHVLPHFHLCPIYLVVFKGSYSLTCGISHLEGGFTLRCLQRLSLPDLATLPCLW